MKRPLLSICIPTYNRADMLAYCLENLRTFDDENIEYEIVVVDHASSDHTPQVIEEAKAKWPNIRSYRQNKQVGLMEQCAAAHRLTRGIYTVCVADDDKLIADKVVAYVREMEAHPKISVTYATWYAYDDAQEKINDTYFHVPARTVFQLSRRLELFDFITRAMAYPEICIYRTDCMHKMFFSRHEGGYHSFFFAYELLKQGDVVFQPEPFYLEIITTKPQFNRPTRVNAEMTTTYLDKFRAGLELLLSRMLKDMGQQKIPDNLRNTMHEILLKYTLNQLGMGFTKAMIDGDFLAASEYTQRMFLWRDSHLQNTKQIGDFLYLRAAVQASVWLYESMSWLKTFYLIGFEKPDDVKTIIARLNETIPVDSGDGNAILNHPEPETILVLVRTDAERIPLLESAVPPGNIISLEMLAKPFEIIPTVCDFQYL
ncbi:MAG: glycosyltransferase family 2 protein [Rickettsiales bacterium]|nr:glycosyltransferase family 2 protein [Rickettsiales bacterium]